jgi:spore coat protein CotH
MGCGELLTLFQHFKSILKMKSIIKIALLSSVLFFSFQASKAQNSLYNLNTVQKIKIYLSQTNWDYQMDTAKYGADGYIMADSVVINGTRLDSVGVKYKGNSSYDSTRVKNPFTISTDQYKSQTYDTYKTLKLANCYKDPSMIREVLAYNILKNYMHCPKANFAEVYVNDKYFGLYSNVENINKNFCATHFGSKKNTFIKCCPLTVASPTSKSNLKYLSADSSAYANYYEMESDYGWNDLTSLANTITNSPSSIASVVDIDRLLWMLAFDNTLVNLDSYMGVFCQNYFLYKDNSGIYNPVVWDLNMSFGGFPYAGSSATSMGTQDTTGLQQLSPTLHSTDAYWPMIKA